MKNVETERGESILWRWITAGTVAAGLTYSGWIEPRRIKWEIIERSFPNLPDQFDGLRIVFISDIHADSFHAVHQVHHLLRSLREMQYDMILIGGDIGERVKPPVIAFMEALHAPLGVYFVMGNHEYYRDARFIYPLLQKYSIKLLRNENISIQRGDQKIYLAGTDDYIESHCDVKRALKGISRDSFTILMCHNPDGVVGTRMVDLSLSGHTHGGQISFFGLWSPMDLRQKRKALKRGWRQSEKGWLLTSVGIGTSNIPFRFCAVPQAHLITLRREKVEE